MKKKSLIILGVIVCVIVIFLGYIFIYKQNGKDSNSLIVLKGETLTGKELLKKISNENVDIEQKITDGVVIDINKSMLDTDMYEVVDVVYLGNNKIKLVVKNKTIVEVVEKEEGVITEPETKKRKLGDIYYDDSIDIRDLVKYAQYVDGLNALSSSDLEYADLNNDGYYDLIDVDILSHCVAGAAKTGDLEFDLEFEVYANNIPDVITGTQAENLLESIKNAKDDAIIYVDATNDSIIKKEVFEAIKDTNKQLHIESSGIEWIFKGKDITNPKQIDTSISVLFDYDYNKTNMKDYIDKSVVILFKDNGELPGISTIRIKLDYVFRSYIGNKIYVYYYNENSKFEEVTGKELEISENGYFEFNIKHNSTYVMSSNKPDNKYISKSKELVKINTSIKEENNNIDYKLIYISLAVVIVLIIVIAIIINLNNKKKKSNTVNNINNDINNINNN